MPAFDNSAIAAKLELYANLLEISGADKYRFLSYKKAANSVRAWPVQASSLADDGRLTEIPGVGAKMAVVIQSVMGTGSFGDLDALCERLPASLAGVMAVPGVGPKRALMLFEKLGVSSIDELEGALESGSVARLGGFGTKTAEKIAAALESHRRHRERIPIGEALPSAEALTAQACELPAVASAHVVGSVRRRSDTVGNLDLLLVTEDAAATTSGVKLLPAVERITADSTSSAMQLELHDGTAVNLHLVAPQSEAAALVYFTGSIKVGERLEELAAARGYSLAPNTFVPVEDAMGGVGNESKWRSEAEVFAALGLQEIPPEAREDVEIVEVAQRGELPTLITLDDIRGDLQTHSTFTDGKNSLQENRATATELGYEYLAVTDHAYNLRMVGGLDLSDLERQWDEIDRLNALDDGGTLLLKGIELNIAEDGSVDYDDEILARFDIALASLHSGWDQDEATVTKRLLTAIEHPLVDVIAHPTGRVLGRRDPLHLDMATILSAAGETGTIMEINSYPDRLDLSAAHIRLGRCFGVRFSLGTDAHAAAQLRYMSYGVGQARRGLVTAGELLNAQRWESARRWLKRNR